MIVQERSLYNLRLLERFGALEDVEAEDQDAVIKLIDDMVVKNKVEGAITPFQKKASNLKVSSLSRHQFTSV